MKEVQCQKKSKDNVERYGGIENSDEFSSVAVNGMNGGQWTIKGD